MFRTAKLPNSGRFSGGSSGTSEMEVNSALAVANRRLKRPRRGSNTVSTSATRRSRAMNRSGTWQRVHPMRSINRWPCNPHCNLTSSGLEIIQQIELEEIDDGRVDLAGTDRRPLDVVRRAVEHHAGRRNSPVPCVGCRQIGIRYLKPHFGVQRTDDKLTYRDRFAVSEEGPDAQIWIHAFNPARVRRPVWAS